jgi:SpoVK/Ycf46/Vps4 family AAA+-type ATPase
MQNSYPGVYIEEISSGVRPISGLSQPVAINRLLAPQDSNLSRALAARLTKGGPGARLLLTGPNNKRRISAAQALARKLHLDLYRVDLATVVSKNIDETEKNLERIFDAARDSGSILLFDEADALFGKRSAVKDSHDRYANVETRFLVQRLDDFRGLAVLAAKRRENIDRAFLKVGNGK